MRLFLAIFFLGAFLGCGGGREQTLDRNIEFPDTAADITQLTGVLDQAFFEENFSNHKIFYDFRNELRALPSVLIPSQYRRLSADNLYLRFSEMINIFTPDAPLFFFTDYKKNRDCSNPISNFFDKDEDGIPSDFKWDTRCKAEKIKLYDSRSWEIKEQVLNLNIHDTNDEDPFSAYEHQIEFKNIIVEGPDATVNNWQYAFPSGSGWAMTLKDNVKAIQVSDLNYSIFLDRSRRSETAEGRRSGVALHVNLNAIPEVVERKEPVSQWSKLEPNHATRAFKDARIFGKFQIMDGFVQFVLENKVWNLKISSTPLDYKWFREDPRNREGFKLDVSGGCGSTYFASGIITLTDVAGNKFEFRYSQNSIDQEVGRAACRVEYFFNDAKIDLGS